MPTAYFTPDLFQFYRELKVNNSREWFEENKARYEASVREPIFQFIRDMQGPLHEISPCYIASDKKVGGSLFRIQRDIRFSSSKLPYKDRAGINFRHEDEEGAHSPGFYMHLEPGNVFLGAGIWCPQPKVAQVIREYLDEHRDEWLAVKKAKGFAKNWSIDETEKMKRPPKGFEAEDELIEDLKLKQFIASRPLTEEDVLSPKFLKTVVEGYKESAPLVRFLCLALKLTF